MKYGFSILLAFLWLSMIAGCDRPTVIKPSGNTIKIGVIGPFSGPERSMGEDGLRGIRTVMQIQPYLDNGDKVELVIEDDKSKPDLSVKGLKKLATEDKVSAILLLSSSAAGLAVNELADSYQVPVLVLLASHPDIAKDKKYVSQLIFDNTFQGRVAALFVRDELLMNRVSVFHNPESFHSTSLANEFIHKFEAIGGIIVADIQVTDATDNFKDTLKRLQKLKTKLLYLPVEAEDFVRISMALEEMNWTPERMGSDGLVANVLRQYPEDADLLEGIIDIDLYTNDIQGTPFGEQAVKVYRQLFDKPGNTFTAVGAEGYAILLQSMNQCTRPGDGQCINSMIHNIDSFEGLMGRISILADGKVERPLIVNRIRNGRTQFIVKVY